MLIQIVLGSLSIAYTQARDEEEHSREREALSVEAILMEWDREPLERKNGSNRTNFQSPLFHGRHGDDPDDVEKSREKIEGEMKRIVECWASVRVHCKILAEWPWFQNFITFAIIVNTGNMMYSTWHDQAFYEGKLCQRRCEFDAHLPASASTDC